MATREELERALHEIPPSILSVLTAKFGDVSSVNTPDNIEDALIVQGKVAANFNNAILMPLSGVPIIELALRIGQNNPSTQAMLLSMLKTTGSLGSDAFTVNLSDGDTFPVGEVSISVNVSKGSASSVSGTFSGPDNVDFDCDKSGSDKAWTASPTITTEGEYTVTIIVAFDTQDKEESVHIEITPAPVEPDLPAP